MTLPPYGILLTDLYQLNMLQAYFERGMTAPAVFELFVRKLPPRRNFLMAAGLEQALQYLETLCLLPAERDWLERCGRFSREFIDWLADLRFTGDVDAMPEGTVFFADEPILRVTAPLPQAQLVETRLLNLVHFQTVIASKAARMVLAASGRALVDFGLRRAHGAEAGLLAARAAYLAGFAGTATAAAAPLFGIPVYGTMAHSFILAHDGEDEAFLSFARSRPDNVVLLIDTYDTEAAAAKVVALAPRLAAESIRIAGVRLDSGDLAQHARRVRAILDAGGLMAVRIFASGGLDEEQIAAHVAAGVPIDSYGIGTSLTVASDAPALDCAYKLQAYAGQPRRKRSEGKATWPGAKQVFRRHDIDGRMVEDTVTLSDEPATRQALLEPVMRGGQRLGPPLPLADARQHAAAELATLPEELCSLADIQPYRVSISETVKALAAQADIHGTVRSSA